MTLPLLSDFTTILELFQHLTDLGYTRAPADQRIPEQPGVVLRPDLRPLVPCWASEEEEALAETGCLMLRIYPVIGLHDTGGMCHLSVTHDADGKIDHRSREICNGTHPPETPVCPEEVTLRYLGQYLRRHFLACGYPLDRPGHGRSRLETPSNPANPTHEQPHLSRRRNQRHLAPRQADAWPCLQ